MIFAVNAGFSMPYRHMQAELRKIENPHKKNGPGTETDADKPIKESEIEESNEGSKKYPLLYQPSFFESPYSIERFYTILATPQISHLNFIVADSEQYLRFRKLLI